MKAPRKNPGRIDSDAKFSALRSKVGITRLLHHLRAISSDELKTLQWRPLHGNRSNCRRTRDVLHCSDVLLVKTRDTETRKSSLASCNGFLPSSYHFIASRPSRKPSTRPSTIPSRAKCWVLEIAGSLLLCLGVSSWQILFVWYFLIDPGQTVMQRAKSKSENISKWTPRAAAPTFNTSCSILQSVIFPTLQHRLWTFICEHL